jgi:hypothetical protein
VLAVGMVGCQGCVAQTQIRTAFHFTVDLAYEAAAPLFGALAEQKWDPEWKPRFVYPDPPADQEGAVFRVDHAGHSSIWTTSVFDLPGGHVQYVVFLNDVIVTRIDIRLARNGAGKMDVSVLYERTALDPKANEHVRTLANNDAKRADAWKAAIEAYAAKQR